jgi:transcriptional regulator with XRE-family HTH domain
MTVNERIRLIRNHRGLKLQELAQATGVSAAAISRIETQHRMPRIDTIQKIAHAFEVTSSFLLGEEDSNLNLSTALAQQSLKKFFFAATVSERERAYLMRLSSKNSAPQTVKGWMDLQENVKLYVRMEPRVASEDQ